MTLNFQGIVERYPNPNDVVGSSNPSLKIFSLLDEKLARWPRASYVPRRRKSWYVNSSKLLVPPSSFRFPCEGYMWGPTFNLKRKPKLKEKGCLALFGGPNGGFGLPGTL